MAGLFFAGLAVLGLEQADATQRFAAKGEIELAFTPRDDAESLLVSVIAQARRSLHVQAYAFTSRRIADAMVAARRRGVDVQVLADARMNRKPKGNVLPRLLAAGVPVALDGELMKGFDLIMALNRLAGSHGVGRNDMIEDRVLGLKARECYEHPAATVLLAAHRDLAER